MSIFFTLQSSSALRICWQSSPQLPIAKACICLSVSSFILAFLSSTQSISLDPCRQEMMNSLATSYSSSSLMSTSILPLSVPTVQEISKSFMQMPALTSPRLMQFMTALLALPSFCSTVTSISIWFFLQRSATIVPSKLLRMFYANSVNQRSCLPLRFQSELKGATVYSILSRNSLLVGLWKGPLTRQSTSVRPCRQRQEPSACASTPSSMWVFLSSECLRPSERYSLRSLKSTLIMAIILQYAKVSLLYCFETIELTICLAVSRIIKLKNNQSVPPAFCSLRQASCNFMLSSSQESSSTQRLKSKASKRCSQKRCSCARLTPPANSNVLLSQQRSSWNLVASIRQVSRILWTLVGLRLKSSSARLQRSRQMIAITRHCGENWVNLWMRRMKSGMGMGGGRAELKRDSHSTPSCSIRSASSCEVSLMRVSRSGSVSP